MELNYKSFGSGPALIILHGLFGSLDNWQTLAKKFGTDYSVFIVDQRNHGKSPHLDSPFTYQAMAEDLEAFLDQHSIWQANLIGHSMGGKTAMQFAADNPERIEKLVVADMSPRQNPPQHSTILEALRNFPFGKIQSRQEADGWLQTPIPDFGIRQFLLKNLVRDREKGFRWKFNFEVIDRDYEKILAAISPDHEVDVPALFLRGGKSDYVPDEDFTLIRSYFPEVEFKTIPGAGHWVHAEAPEPFYQAVIEYLQA